MRSSVASSALATALVLTPVAAGYAPALCQDFSITNQVEPANPARRDLMRQLQAWWDAHAYYPRHASNNDEGGTVKVHLVIVPWGQDLDGRCGGKLGLALARHGGLLGVPRRIRAAVSRG